MKRLLWVWFLILSIMGATLAGCSRKNSSVRKSKRTAAKRTVYKKVEYSITVREQPRFDYKKIKRVAVIGFENRSSERRAGEILSDAFETALVKYKTYEVITRREFKNILEEKNIAASALVRTDEAKRIGKVLSVDAIVVGAVNTYKIETERKSKPVKGGNLRKNATVVLNIKLIETTNGRVIYAYEGIGNWWEFGYEGSSNFSADELILKKARDASAWDCLKGMVVYWQPRKMMGYPVRIGVHIRAKNDRVFIEATVPGSPAEMAGFRTGDIITRVNGLAVTQIHQVIIQIRNTPPGQPVKMEIDRAGETIKTVLIPAYMPTSATKQKK